MNTCKFIFILYKLSPFQTLWLLKYKLLNLSTRFYILFFLAFFSPHYQEQVISTWKTHLSFVWKLETHQFHTSSKAAFMVTVHLVTGGACLKWCCICWRLPAGHLLIFVIGRVFTAILIIFRDRTLKSQTKEIIKTEICNNLKTWDYMGGGTTHLTMSWLPVSTSSLPTSALMWQYCLSDDTYHSGELACSNEYLHLNGEHKEKWLWCWCCSGVLSDQYRGYTSNLNVAV